MRKRALALVLLGCCFLAQPQVFGAGAVETDSSDEAIYQWVAEEMAVEPVWPMPAVCDVDQATLATRFKQINGRVFPILSAKYGLRQARTIMARYLDGLVGLYDARTKTIYVGIFLDGCRRRSVLAHEICHFFQLQGAEAESRPAMSAELVQLKRELAAQHIEQTYRASHCPAR